VSPTAAPPAVRSSATPLPLREMLLRSAVVLVVVAAAIMVVLGTRYWVLASVPDRTAQALEAARTRTGEILGYDTATLDVDLATARAQVTGEFAHRFEEIAAQLVLPASRARSVVTRAEVVRAAVVAQTPDRVETLLFVHQVTTSAAEPQPRTSTSEIMVTMALVGDQWLVARLEPV